jgi:hypothetical protein
MEDGTVEEEREPVFVYVHCYNAACVKYHNLQENLNFERKVPGIREETQYTYVDRGGDMPGIENTHVAWHVQNPDDVMCDACGMPTNISQNPSRKLQQYGVAPGTGLQGAERAAALAAAKVNESNAVKDVEIAELRAEMAKLMGFVDKLVKGQTK